MPGGRAKGRLVVSESLLVAAYLKMTSDSVGDPVKGKREDKEASWSKMGCYS